MKNSKSWPAVFLLCISLALAGCSSSIENKAAAESSSPRRMADAEFARAYKLIEAAPSSAKGHIELAALFIKRARRTSDFSFNDDAMAAIDKAIELEPENQMARKLRASLLATFHRFDEAREAMLELAKELPNDPFIYGILVDANVELGNYEEAVEAAQTMADLKPYAPSYARAGLIRSIHGEYKGALEMFELAYRTSDPADAEAQSWALVQLAKEYFKYGQLEKSEAKLIEALQILPDYQSAVIEHARVKASLGDLPAATVMLENANAKNASAESHILLGRIYAKQGNDAGMQEQFLAAEEVAQETDGDMHGFALVWADYDMRLDEALDIAVTDGMTNKDIISADITAWCLYKKGRHAEAKEKIADALRIKSNDALILYHAGKIEYALGNHSEARRYLDTALKTNPYFDLVHADLARTTLQELTQSGS